MSAARLSLAILTHNALGYTKRCLQSLADHTPIEHEVLVLDNGSEDETPDWLARYPACNVRAMLSPVNLGVPKGRNLLMSAIQRQGGGSRFLVFLDNDVEVSEDWYRPFLDVFEADASVAIAGVTGHDIIIHGDRRELMPSPEFGPVPVDVVSGFCFWVQWQAALRLGPFDENLGMFWHEDDDYCVRAIAEGYRVISVPEARVVHHAHQSGVARQDEDCEQSLRNQRYLVGKWHGLGLVDASGCIRRPASPSRTSVPTQAQ